MGYVGLGLVQRIPPSSDVLPAFRLGHAGCTGGCWLAPRLLGCTHAFVPGFWRTAFVYKICIGAGQGTSLDTVSVSHVAWADDTWVLNASQDGRIDADRIERPCLARDWLDDMVGKMRVCPSDGSTAHTARYLLDTDASRNGTSRARTCASKCLAVLCRLVRNVPASGNPFGESAGRHSMTDTTSGECTENLYRRSACFISRCFPC